MKLLTKTVGNKQHSFICLESIQDAHSYSIINAQIKSHQAVNFWIGFKSQTFRATPFDYLVHEVSGNNIAPPLCTKIQFKEGSTSLVEYCGYADSIINDMNACIYKYISRGDMVRLNTVGGYCPIKDLDEYDSINDIGETEMFNFLLHKNTRYEFEIKGNHLVIENDNYTPKDLINEYSKFIHDSSGVQVFDSFKHRTILFKQQDFIRLFTNGIKQGLANIIFETTAQDVPQLNKLKSVLEYIMPLFPTQELTIWCKIDKRNRHLITSNVKNININFL